MKLAELKTLEKVEVEYKIPKNLLSIGTSNAKTKKNGRDTRILYLAPATQNSRGADMCPNRSAGCTASCLFTAGRGRMSNVANARINRTEYFLDDPKDLHKPIDLGIGMGEPSGKAYK